MDGDGDVGMSEEEERDEKEKLREMDADSTQESDAADVKKLIQRIYERYCCGPCPTSWSNSTLMVQLHFDGQTLLDWTTTSGISRHERGYFHLILVQMFTAPHENRLI